MYKRYLLSLGVVCALATGTLLTGCQESPVAALETEAVLSAPAKADAKGDKGSDGTVTTQEEPGHCRFRLCY